MPTEDVFTLLKIEESENYAYTIEELKQAFYHQTGQELKNKFNEMFKTDHAGNRYDWRTVEEHEIKLMFDHTKLKLEKRFNQFKLIKLA